MDGSCVYNQLYTAVNILSALSVMDFYALTFKMPGDGAFVIIGSGDHKATIDENFGKSAHADSADSHKMNFDWSVEIDLIHILHILFLILPLFGRPMDLYNGE